MVAPAPLAKVRMSISPRTRFALPPSIISVPPISLRLHGEGLAPLRDDDLGILPCHSANELVGIRLDDRKRAVVARDHRIELEKALASEGRALAAHGEAVADRDDADLGMMLFLDQRHVAEHVGVAHVIDARLARRLDDEAARIAEVDRRGAFQMRR